MRAERADGGRGNVAPAASAALLAALAAVLPLGACVTGLSRSAGPGGAAAAGGPVAPGDLDERFVPALEVVLAALSAGNDPVARRALDGLLARGPEGATLEFALSLDQVLAGRATAASLDLRLEIEFVSEPGRGEGTRIHVDLALERGEALELELLAPRLVRQAVAVDALGTERRWREEVSVAALERIRLVPPPANDGGPAPDRDSLADPESGLETDPPAGGHRVSARIDGGFHPLPRDGALAVREVWRLETRGGWARIDGQRLPLRRIGPARVEAVHLSSLLPGEPLDAAPLIEFLGRSAPFLRPREEYLPPLMERAVRIPPERRPQAVADLARALPELSDDRLRAALPALRWVAADPRPGMSVSAWRRWFDTRARMRREPGREALFLPDRPAGS